jgi:hypothetical protein
LKSFGATTTPSISLLAHPSSSFNVLLLHTAEEVLVDLLAIRSWNKHDCDVRCSISTMSGGLERGVVGSAVILKVAVRDP